MAYARIPEAAVPSTKELGEAIAIARHRGHATFTDSEIRRLLAAVAIRFPGMQILQIRPRSFRGGEYSILVLRWDQAQLLRHAIARPEHIPVHPKRLVSYKIPHDEAPYLLGKVLRASRGRLTLRADVADDIDPGAPLALFRPSAIRAGSRPRAQRPYLRLVVDNTKEKQP